ncbi:MAG: hypothetical protein PHS14_08835 [Elusimicrobia bacterium]|nr:hypothetical protein [Elusimicrobiota bacterium]
MMPTNSSRRVAARRNIILPLLCLLLASACGHAPVNSRPKPDWAVTGGGVFTEGERRVLRGIGSAASRSAADKSARNEIAKEVRVVINTLAEKFKAAISAQDSSGQTTPDFSREYIGWLDGLSARLAGKAEIAERWREPETGAVFSKAEVDGAAVLRDFEESGGVSVAMKHFAPAIWPRILDQAAASGREP